MQSCFIKLNALPHIDSLDEIHALLYVLDLLIKQGLTHVYIHSHNFLSRTICTCIEWLHHANEKRQPLMVYFDSRRIFAMKENPPWSHVFVAGVRDQTLPRNRPVFWLDICEFKYMLPQTLEYMKGWMKTTNKLDIIK